VKCRGCGEWYNDSSEMGLVVVWDNKEIRGEEVEDEGIDRIHSGGDSGEGDEGSGGEGYGMEWKRWRWVKREMMKYLREGM
jgi:hypothetical protein